MVLAVTIHKYRWEENMNKDVIVTQIMATVYPADITLFSPQETQKKPPLHPVPLWFRFECGLE